MRQIRRQRRRGAIGMSVALTAVISSTLIALAPGAWAASDGDVSDGWAGSGITESTVSDGWAEAGKPAPISASDDGWVVAVQAEQVVAQRTRDRLPEIAIAQGQETSVAKTSSDLTDELMIGFALATTFLLGVGTTFLFERHQHAAAA